MPFILFSGPVSEKKMWDCKTLPRIPLICCQGVKSFLLKDYFKFCNKLSFVTTLFWVLSQIDLEKFSHFEFLGFVTTWVLWIFKEHNMCFWSLSKLKIFSLVTILVIDFFFSHNLSFWVLSQLHYFSFVIIWVLEFCHKMSFGALSQFEFCHNWSFPIN